MYEVFLHMQHNTKTEKLILILYNENNCKLIKCLMQKCTSWQWVNIKTSGSISPEEKGCQSINHCIGNWRVIS